MAALREFDALCPDDASSCYVDSRGDLPQLAGAALEQAVLSARGHVELAVVVSAMESEGAPWRSAVGPRWLGSGLAEWACQVHARQSGGRWAVQRHRRGAVEGWVAARA